MDVQWAAPPAAATRVLGYVVLRRSGTADFAEIARTADLRVTDRPGSGAFDYVVRATISTFTSADSQVASVSTIP